MNLFWLGRLGQAMASQTLWGTFNGALTASWDETPVDAPTVYDEARDEYVDPVTRLPVAPIPRNASFAAYFDQAANLEHKYKDYGVDSSTDAVALVPHDAVIPPTTAKFFRAGQPGVPYKLMGLIAKADIGIGIPGMPPETAYKVLHLRRG